MKKKIDTDKILLTSPLLPAIEDFLPHIEEIWSSGIITNRGQYHDEFESELKKYLGVKYISLVSSGTTALMIALKSLNLNGEVITTPFSHISTSQAIVWNNLTPVYADVKLADFNIDVLEIEKLITPNTQAILGVHIFGHPCQIDDIHHLAKKHNLKVVYDAAHCFGVNYQGQSICNFGDLSVLSFHATKVFNTIEGGAIISNNQSTKNLIDALINSGMDKNGHYLGHGFNAKLNELQAAFGLVQLKNVGNAVDHRRYASKLYREQLASVKGVSVMNNSDEQDYNYSYFPILIDQHEFGCTRDQLAEFLEENYVFPKKYFSPLITDYDGFDKFKISDLSKAQQLADKVLCLPLSHSISIDAISKVVELIKKNLKRNTFTSRYPRGYRYQ